MRRQQSRQACRFRGSRRGRASHDPLCSPAPHCCPTLMCEALAKTVELLTIRQQQELAQGNGGLAAPPVARSPRHVRLSLPCYAHTQPAPTPPTRGACSQASGGVGVRWGFFPRSAGAHAAEAEVNTCGRSGGQKLHSNPRALSLLMMRLSPTHVPTMFWPPGGNSSLHFALREKSKPGLP
jgi:hypothetical protein